MVLRFDRPFDHALVEPHDEDEALQVEEELHRLEHLERALGEAAVEIVDEDDDPPFLALEELLERRLELGKAGEVERRRPLGRLPPELFECLAAVEAELDARDTDRERQAGDESSGRPVSAVHNG